jgi:hypothetical protein
VFVIRLRAAVPFCATLIVSLALAQWPEGDVTGRDREVVARLTRGGVQRLEDAVHVDHDAFDASVSHRPDGAAAPASTGFVPATAKAPAPPVATRRRVAFSPSSPLVTAPAVGPLGRAPPAR